MDKHINLLTELLKYYRYKLEERNKVGFYWGELNNEQKQTVIKYNIYFVLKTN